VQTAPAAVLSDDQRAAYEQQRVLGTAQQETQQFIESGEADLIDEPTGRMVETQEGPQEETVRDVMADLMIFNARRGVTMTMAQAYRAAVQLHPDLAQAMAQREAAKQAQASQATVARAQRASSSVQSRPGVANGGAKKPQSMTDFVEWAYNQATNNSR